MESNSHDRPPISLNLMSPEDKPRKADGQRQRKNESSAEVLSSAGPGEAASYNHNSIASELFVNQLGSFRFIKTSGLAANPRSNQRATEPPRSNSGRLCTAPFVHLGP